MSILISVGLPIVKTKFLQDSIESVLNQSYKNIEFIILNNGKTSYYQKEIREIVNSYSDNRIKYYENFKQLTIIQDWNKCLSFAKGKYFVLFSDDDIYENNFLEELYKLAFKYPQVNIFHSRINVINEESKVINWSASLPEWESCLEFIWHRLNGLRLQFAPEFMVKTKTLKSLGGFIDLPLAWGSDDATWFSLAREKGIVATNKVLCNWRISEFNLSKTGNIYLRLEAVNKFEKWFNLFIKDIPCLHSTDENIIKTINNILRYKIDNSKLLLLNDLSNKYISYFYKLLILYTKKKKYNINSKLFLRSFLKKISKMI